MVMSSVENQMWVEKYRPDSLDEVIGNGDVVDLLKKWVDDDSVPNLMFAGPAGVGKTASAVAFAKDKYGDDWKNHFLQLNASDDRGIDVVREEVKDFARLSTVSDHQFKLIFLDEADSLTRDAQPALRRIMEDYSDRTRFILSCNYPEQIIDPIQSRCSVLRMSPVGREKAHNRLVSVLENEGVEYNDDQIERIIERSDGDMRTAIHTLQSAVIDGMVRDPAIETLHSYPDRSDIEEIFRMAVEGDFEAMSRIDELMNDGIDAQAVLEELTSVVKVSDLPDDAKMKMIDKIAEAEYRVTHGSNPRVQLNAVIADLRVARHLSLEPYRRANDE